MTPRSLFALALLTSACTQLGPVPGVTGASVLPRPSPGIEAQAGLLPGYFLSDATADADTRGTTVSQVSGFVEPGKLIGVENLAVGVRHVSGGDDSGHFEPMLRYRHGLTDYFAVGVVGFGTHAKASYDQASYSMTRGGLEAGLDLRIVPKNHWAELHLLGGASAMGLSAQGHYCQRDDGYGTSCEGSPANASARIEGIYPSVFGGISVDLANRLGFFHGLRAQALVATGTMPTVRFAEQMKAEGWSSFGLALSVALGAKEEGER